MISTILAGATIVDGTGGAGFTTDVGIVDDKIALIGDLAEREAVHRVDCKGKVLAPGFIDSHSRGDGQWLTNQQIANKLLQGCTSEIGGHDGRSACLSNPETGGTVDAFLQAVAQSRPALNVATLAGWNDARDLAPSDHTAALLRDACERGALGVSVAPATWQTTPPETIAADVRASGASLVATGITPEPGEAERTLEDVLLLADGAALRIGDLRVRGRGRQGRMHALLQRCDRARDRGADVAADVFPYIGSPAALRTLLPPGTAPENIKDEAAIRAMCALIELRLDGAFDRAIIAGMRDERDAAWCGRTLAEYAGAMRLSPPRATLSLLERNGMDVDAFLLDSSEDDVAGALSAPFVVPATADGTYAMRDGDSHRLPHPRAFGTFPRTIRRFARQLGTGSFEATIATMTSQPARLYGLRNRGSVTLGAYADLVVFDRERFADTATYSHPRTLPDGLQHVYVNGRAAVRDGIPTGSRAGRVLRGDNR